MYSPEKWVENRFVKYPVCVEEGGGGVEMNNNSQK